MPTKDATGSPFRVDARFHATLSRTALDRVDNHYNRLLDEAAAELAAGLLLRLRDAAPTSGLVEVGRARRMVTYGLAAQGSKSFGEAVRKRVASEAVVWDRSGSAFLVPRDARRLVKDDLNVVELAIERLGLSAVQEHGLNLVDDELEREASAVLQALRCPMVEPGHMLGRPEGSSIIEALASVLPREDVASWSVLLGWVLDRAAGKVSDQRILPVAGGALVRPEDAPFVPLGQSPVRGELSITDVPAELLSDLLFIDGSVLGDDPKLRRALVEGARPLCHKASAYVLLEHALLPALGRLIQVGEEARARQVLALGLRLLATVPSTESVDALPWQVPCGAGWITASDAYLGDAWANEERKAENPPGLVEAVYGSVGRCVVPWWESAEEREAARLALQRAGVADTPRIFTWEPIEEVFWGDYHRGEVRNGEPPDPVLAAIWPAWLTFVARSAAVDWGPRTWWGLDGVQWIDGLERPEAVQLLAQWALGQKHGQARLVPQQETGGRYRPKQGGGVDQPWALALRQLDSPFVPTAKNCVFKGQPARPSDLCRVPVLTHAHTPSWLPQAGPGLNQGTLELIGVRALADMPSAWLLGQLGAFANSLSGAAAEGAMARGLWDLLAKQVGGAQLPPLDDALLPLWLDGILVAAGGREIDRLVLVDDAYAAEVLGSRLDGAFLLEPGEHDWSQLLRNLRDALSHAQVEAVSELELPFAPDPYQPMPEVAEYLRARGGARLLGVLAAVLHRSGASQKEMLRCWRALQDAKVQHGVLGMHEPPAVWLAEPGVLVTQPLAPADLVVEIWPILGARWRDDLLALGHALGKGVRGLRDHLRHKKIGDEAIAAAAAHFKLEDWQTPAALPAVPPLTPGAATVKTEVALVDIAVQADGDDGDAYGGTLDTHALTTQIALARLPTNLPERLAPTLDAGVERPHRRPQVSSFPRPAPTGGSHGNEAYAREIGHLGGFFAFRFLQSKLPDFDERCWVSSSRVLLGLPPGDDTLGYDFTYVDTSGLLSGRPGATCFIDVKANAKAMRRRFSVSANEWELARVCSASEDQIFVVLRVHGIATQPEVGALIVDPVGHAASGRLRLAPKDGWWVDLVEDGADAGEV